MWPPGLSFSGQGNPRLCFAQNGQYEDSLNVLSEMHRVGALKPNSVTIAGVVPALACLGCVGQGKAIHSYAIKCGYESHVSAMNSLMDMYVKCGNMEDARRLFDNMSQRDVVSWNTIIGGYAFAGYSYDYEKKNLSLNLNLMRLEGVIPDSVTIINIVSGCGQAGALEQGRRVHSYLIRNGFESHLSVGNALIDMYAKCGNAEAAHHVFAQMPQTNVISWNTLIGGYGMNGFGQAALGLFYKMQQQCQGQGLKPNYVTFIAILSACSHAGLVTEGLQIFDSITQYYDIAPTVEHYACVVDLLGRAGRLDDAHSLIAMMPVEVEADASVWGALLGGCRIHRHLELGKCAAEHLFQLEPKNTGNYLLLANMYAASGMWEQCIQIRTIMKNKGLRKTPGCSWIEAKNMLHVFRAGDQSHPQSKGIYETLERLSEQMEGAGYKADTTFALINVEEEEKDQTLNVHSERLAIAFGLINIPCGTPIRISKNLRMCGDCHNATKFISRIVCREIIVRDSHRFHRFKDGLCSCGNYW
ncbi:pentatricopeptide repeat-containing protein At3g57430, chloroplastic [Cryptomeria japonica]|uniref:pentatricopeptide repeat-containing protein At3g57430, chloroplastic n=1 Tax=Cryptomeria japonica TaxID=3369 RepID=UPI0027DA90E5|nr:pentatricopeptide repeat-containing protein At3g57430, chloroplastic [Cryptomeria japonica]